jgi:hypothetical protein
MPLEWIFNKMGLNTEKPVRLPSEDLIEGFSWKKAQKYDGKGTYEKGRWEKK